jgi:hypothetical protein
LKEKLEFLEITGKVFQSERLVIISSVIPSTKYSCSESPLMFAKGRTAIAGGFSVEDCFATFDSGSFL